MSKVGIVVPVLNNFEQAVGLVQSAKSEKHDIQFYVQPQWLFQIPLAAAWNHGIQEAFEGGCDYVIVANDDVYLAHWSIDQMVSDFQLKNDKQVILYARDVYDIIQTPIDMMLEEEGSRDWNSVPVIEDQTFACFMIDKSFFDKVGTFDHNFDPAWWEDTDMKYRIKLLGYEPLYSSAPYVHFRHQTTKNLTQPLNSQKSGEYYVKKWGSARKDLNEAYRLPYNDSSLSPKEWRQ